MDWQFTGSQNGYNFTITREQGNKYFTFVYNDHMRAEYYTYGAVNTIGKLYDFIGDPKEVVK